MLALRVLLPFWVIAALVHNAEAAALREKSTIAGPSIRIGDLWDQAGPKSAIILGPAPPPGASITVQAPQLAAIARQFDIDWQPTSPITSTTLTRPGVPLPLPVLSHELKQALSAAATGIPPQSLGLALSGYQPPEIDEAAVPHIHVDDLRLDRVRHYVQASVSLQTTAGQKQVFEVAGRYYWTRAVLVSTHPLGAGAVLAPTDVTLLDREDTGNSDVTADQDRVVGQRLAVSVAGGEEIHPSLLRPPVLIHRHDAVIVSLNLPGFTATATCESLDEGTKGSLLRVRNMATGVVLTGRVVGPGRATVITPGGNAAVVPE